MWFSQRIGKTPIKTQLQIESMDDDLKNCLWNAILEGFLGRLQSSNKYGLSQKQEACKTFWKDFFKFPMDDFPTESYSTKISTSAFLQKLREWYYKAEWYEIYDLVEFILSFDLDRLIIVFEAECNEVLKQEVAGYRIVNNKIVQITSEEEVKEIEEAITSTDKWTSVNTHLKTALDFLADRENPNYRNSIKESISAIESLCKIITGDSKATLGPALTAIENKYALHGSLKKAFTALYGYTSDSSGIRHSLLEDGKQVEFEDAKFMLVTCSAFINYLKTKMGNLLISDPEE